MFKTFIEELKHIFCHKYRWLEWLIIAFLPFLYGFLYMNAYWNPFGHSDKLRIAVVDLNKNGNSTRDNVNDKSNQSQSTLLTRKMIEEGKKGVKVGSHDYKFTIDPLDKIYSEEHQVKELVDNNKYDAVIIIDKNYETLRQNMVDGIKSIISETFFDSLIKGNKKNIDYNQLISDIEDKLLINGNKKQLITFYNSVKNSYLAGEMTNFGAGLASLKFTALLPTTDEITQKIIDDYPNANISSFEKFEIKIAMNIIKFGIKNGGSSIINTEPIGGNINTYGFGLSPYFICIGLWAGALAMTFLIKNERHKKHISTFKHYFGKSMMWILTGWIQSLILITGITIQGVDLGVNQWQLFLLAIFISTIFTLIVQAVAYALRYGDLGEFAAVVMLIIQLISSSGTFPVDLQSEIFKIINPIIPFTYGIKSIRELLYMPDSSIVLKNLGILIIFPAIFIPISLSINYIFDKKTKVKDKHGKYSYKSFEINLGDF